LAAGAWENTASPDNNDKASNPIRFIILTPDS
jgi:hypothetical protein